MSIFLQSIPDLIFTPQFLLRFIHLLLFILLRLISLLTFFWSIKLLFFSAFPFATLDSFFRFVLHFFFYFFTIINFHLTAFFFLFILSLFFNIFYSSIYFCSVFFPLSISFIFCGLSYLVEFILNISQHAVTFFRYFFPRGLKTFYPLHLLFILSWLFLFSHLFETLCIFV